jgi:hypothetical protein
MGLCVRVRVWVVRTGMRARVRRCVACAGVHERARAVERERARAVERERASVVSE